jgi:hypothetical protein
MTSGGEGNIGYTYGEYHAQRVSEGLNRIEENGKTVAQNVAKKIMESRRSYEGDNNPFYGKTHSEESKKKMRKPKSNSQNMKKTEETKKKIAEAITGKPKSEEAKENMRKAKAKEPKRTCPHCGKEGKGGNMTRYHFDNCNTKA